MKAFVSYPGVGCLVLAMLATACHHESAALPPASPGNTQKTGDLARLADDPLAFLPLDSDVVISVDLERLRESQAWRDQLVPLFQLRPPADTDKIRTKCGFDPINQIKRISIAVKKVDRAHKDTTFVMRGLDLQTFECVVTTSGANQSIRHDANVAMISGAQPGDVVAAASVGPTSIIVHAAANASRASVESRLRIGAPLRTSTTFMTSFEQLDSAAPIWAVVSGKDPTMFGSPTAPGPKPTGLDLTLALTDAYVLVARIASANATDAGQMEHLGHALVANAKGWVEKLDVTRDGNVVRFEALMNLQQLKNILPMVVSALGLWP